MTKYLNKISYAFDIIHHKKGLRNTECLEIIYSRKIHIYLLNNINFIDQKLPNQFLIKPLANRYSYSDSFCKIILDYRLSMYIKIILERNDLEMLYAFRQMYYRFEQINYFNEILLESIITLLICNSNFKYNLVKYDFRMIICNHFKSLNCRLNLEFEEFLSRWKIHFGQWNINYFCPTKSVFPYIINLLPSKMNLEEKKETYQKINNLLILANKIEKEIYQNGTSILMNMIKSLNLLIYEYEIELDFPYD